jgi:hypothetical protein
MPSSFPVRRAILLLGGLVLAATACSSSASGGSPGTSGPPQDNVNVTSPANGVQVTATVSAATLGDECTGATAGSMSDTAFAGVAADAGTKFAADAGGCMSTCRGSNVQLVFNATGGSGTARVEIVEVTLHDGGSGAELDTLTAASPQAWNGTNYTAWDQTLKSGTKVQATYSLSSPAWSHIGSNGGGTYSTEYRLYVTLRIDGVTATVQSQLLNREPAVAT